MTHGIAVYVYPLFLDMAVKGLMCSQILILLFHFVMQMAPGRPSYEWSVSA